MKFAQNFLYGKDFIRSELVLVTDVEVGWNASTLKMVMGKHETVPSVILIELAKLGPLQFEICRQRD
jgi:hypothetical protein